MTAKIMENQDHRKTKYVQKDFDFSVKLSERLSSWEKWIPNILINTVMQPIANAKIKNLR